MKQELKICIQDHSKLDKQLKEIGAVFLQETHFIDTYFNAPKGNVLKIVQDENGITLVRFAQNEGKFDVVGREKIANPQKTLEQLTTEHGINRILKGTRKYYTYQDLELTFNLIEEVGEFLIVTAESGQEIFIKDILKIQNPEYITVPFNEL